MKTKNKKLWQKNNSNELDSFVEDYTVGIDYILDYELVKYDAIASIAHVKMLCSIKVITEEEQKKLIKGLKIILNKIEDGEFDIEKEDEDCHTAIENFLTEKYGDVGKKIHTGRSRNDQILTAIRLHMKEKTKELISEIENLIHSFENKIDQYGDVVMPGYTHMQKAMPSSVSLWLGSFMDSLKDDLVCLKGISKVIDQNPLGSVAGYGENVFGLDREMTTRLLKFSHIQENPMYCAMSRGKFEFMLLQIISFVMFDINKFATDLMLYTTFEYSFCSLPDSFTTGSSVMPQKHNYDAVELMIAYCSMFPAIVSEIQNVIWKLPSGYSRGFQLTKEPYLKGMKISLETIKIASLVVDNLIMNVDKLKKACTKELYATEEAYKLVKNKNIPFREAYKIIGKKYNKLSGKT